MSRPTLAQHLSELSKPMPKETVSDEEIAAIFKQIENDAVEAATNGEKQLGYNLDSFKRRGSAKVIPRGRLDKLEQLFREHGLEYRYSNDMSCGWCNMRDCPKHAHWGYILTWP